VRTKQRATKSVGTRSSAAADRNLTGSESSAKTSIQAKSPQIDAITNGKSPTDNSRALKQLKDSEQAGVAAPVRQLAAFSGVVQCTLMPLGAFEAQFSSSKERKTDVHEYYYQICDDLKAYHQNEYDTDKSIPEEMSIKYEARKEALLHLRASGNRWLGGLMQKRPAAAEEQKAWDTVKNLIIDAEAELEKYYKNDEGRQALHDLLSAKKQQKQADVYSTDEFKADADLDFVRSRVGDMGAVVDKLKAFHAIKENPADDSTREAKLKTLDDLVQLSVAAIQSIHETQKRKTYKEGFPGFWQNWHKSQLMALDNLISMLKNSRGRYDDPGKWGSNLRDIAARNEDAADGKGVKVEDGDDGWYEVHEEQQADEHSPETAEILKNMAPPANG